MKNSLLITLSLLVSCSHSPPKLQEFEEEVISTNSPLVSISQQTTHKASEDEINRSMLNAHFIEYDKNLKKTEVFFASFEKKNLDPEKSFYEFSPAIITKKADSPDAEFITWSELSKYGWVGTAQLPEKGFYWGFLDYQVEGYVSEIMVIASFDSGRTWIQLPSLKKDYFADEFYAFTMDENGLGTATIKRSGEGTDETKGFDIFKTNDFGKSWSTSYFQSSNVNFENMFDDNCNFRIKPTKKIPKECIIPIERSHL